MRIRDIAFLLGVASSALGASAQVITTPGITASLDLTWQEDPVFPHNDNGLLETGEHALLLMTASFTGQFTQVNVVPPQGGFSSGTILGLAFFYFDIRTASGDARGLYNGGITSPTSSSLGPNADDAGMSGYGVRGGWRLGGNVANGLAVGSPPECGFVNVGPGQYPAHPADANTANPVENLERLGWAPSSYSDRTVVFSVYFAAGGSEVDVIGLYLGYDATVGGAASLDSSRITRGSVSIPLHSVPAPSGLLVLLAPIASRHRRRRGAAKEGPR